MGYNQIGECMPFKLKCNHNEIKQALLNKETYTIIAERHNVTRQRIQQLAKQFKINPLLLRQQDKRDLYNLKWGNKTGSDIYQAQRQKFRAKRKNAKRDGIEWLIEFGELDWPSRCPILNLELDYFAEYRKEESVSFDRIDSSKGYIKDNVQIISWRANRIKNDGTASEHRKIADFLDKLVYSSPSNASKNSV
ncbi:MAG: hypothetical protein NUV80_06490 [Candidatus Berkelbacteria bacterium]|nr:hypothetical protein [Candidatus Berkelbacteria bacterium]